MNGVHRTGTMRVPTHESPVVMPHIALVTTATAHDLDDDLLPLAAALRARGADVSIIDWDDPTTDWSRFDIALLRSPWDYTQRATEFLAWAEHAAARTRLLNPIDIVRWNVDKHYLGDLAARGVSIVPSRFIEPHEDAGLRIDMFLSAHAEAAEFVVKPVIGAGSRDAQRYARAAHDDAVAHVRRLLDAERSVLLQPYLDRVDEVGETSLIYIEGEFSHAIRKGALLQRGADSTRALFAPEQITARTPDAAERDLAQRTLAAIPFGQPLLYARVDLIRDDTGEPRLLELELTEPSLFFAQSAGSAERFARALLTRATTHWVTD